MSTPTRKKIGTVHFRVDFQFLTDKAREFWAEHSFDRAVELITCNGIALEVAHDIIRGKKKMAQLPGGRDGVEGTIVSDKWKPDLSRCQHGLYPDPSQLGAMAAQGARDAEEKARLEQSVREASVQTLFDEISAANKEYEWDEVLRLFDLYDELPEAVRQKHPLNYNRTTIERVARDSRAAKNREADGLPDMSPVAVFVRNQTDLDTRPAPVPSKEYESGNAWVLPNGKFYALNGSMEHIWGANAIAGKTEEQAEKAGWMKLATTTFGVNIVVHGRGATQKQLDTLWDWVQADEARRTGPYNTWKEFFQ